MKIDIKKITVIAVLAAAVFVSGSFAAAVEISAFLKEVPAENTKKENEINAEIFQSGPDTIRAICGLIVPPGTGDDTKVRYAISSLVSYTSRPGADAEKKMFAGLLTEALKKADNKEVKSFFLTQLQFVAGDDSVEEISKYLNDERLSEPAAFTLQSIGTEKAAKAVLDALDDATADTLPTLVYALGQMRVKDAVSRITGYASSENENLRLITLAALAEIGDPDSTGVFKKAMAMKAKNPYEKSIIASNYVTLAKRLSEQNYIRKAVEMSKGVLRSKDSAIKSSDKAFALVVLVDALGPKADDYLEYAFDDGDKQLQDAAMTLSAKCADSALIKMWGKKLNNTTPAKQVRIVEMLAKVDDSDAGKYLRQAYKHGNNSVKTAVIKGLAAGDKSDAADAVSYLMEAVSSNDRAYVKAAKSLLLQIPTDQFAYEAIDSLSEVNPAGKVALIDVLSERRVYKSLDAIFSLTGSDDITVQTAAIMALDKLAKPADMPRIVDLMVQTESPRKQALTGRVIAKLALDKEYAAPAEKPLIAAMKDASTDRQVAIITVLPSIGTEDALDVVAEKLKSTDRTLRDAAIRSLVKWPDTEALDELLSVAMGTIKLNYNVITLRAYVNLVANSDMSDKQKVADLKKAMFVTRRDDEKRYVISRLSQINSVDALAYAVELLDDKSIADAASTAIVKIALPDKKSKGLEGSMVKKLLQKALPKIPDEATRTRVQDYIK